MVPGFLGFVHYIGYSVDKKEGFYANIWPNSKEKEKNTKKKVACTKRKQVKNLKLLHLFSISINIINNLL